jgi:hypothetical protein
MPVTQSRDTLCTVCTPLESLPLSEGPGKLWGSGESCNSLGRIPFSKASQRLPMSKEVLLTTLPLNLDENSTKNESLIQAQGFSSDVREGYFRRLAKGNCSPMGSEDILKLTYEDGVSFQKAVSEQWKAL